MENLEQKSNQIEKIYSIKFSLSFRRTNMNCQELYTRVKSELKRYMVAENMQTEVPSYLVLFEVCLFMCLSKRFMVAEECRRSLLCGFLRVLLVYALSTQVSTVHYELNFGPSFVYVLYQLIGHQRSSAFFLRHCFFYYLHIYLFKISIHTFN